MMEQIEELTRLKQNCINLRKQCDELKRKQETDYEDIANQRYDAENALGELLYDQYVGCEQKFYRIITYDKSKDNPDCRVEKENVCCFITMIETRGCSLFIHGFFIDKVITCRKMALHFDFEEIELIKIDKNEFMAQFDALCAKHRSQLDELKEAEE